MRLPQTGGCQCGKLRYEISEAPLLVLTCHCTDCQAMTSSAFSMGVIVKEAAFRLTAGVPRLIPRIADSGRALNRWVCPECASWISGHPRPEAATRNVRGGTFDDTSWLRPTVHLWTRSKQPWVVLPEGDQKFETQPADLSAFFASGGASAPSG